MTSAMTDNRTTELLRKLLDERSVEYEAYESEREKELEELVRDLLQLRCRQSCADCEHEDDEGCDFMTRALELGIEVY